MKKLKIAMFCTNIYPTPPTKGEVIYSPLWITYFLADGMTKKGHQVYLFASHDSKFKKYLISSGLYSLAKNKIWKNIFDNSNERWKERVATFYENLALSKLYLMAQKDMFDVIHIHPAQRALPFAPLAKTPVVYTLHDALDWNNGVYRHMYEKFCSFKNIYFVSLSNAQRNSAKRLRYIKTIYNGIDSNMFNFDSMGGQYLAYVGRIIPEKGVDIAIKVAKKLNITFKIAGSYNPSSDYWCKKIKPYFNKKIKYIGLLPYNKTVEIYQKARVVIFPIVNWLEPGALSPLEAMACGTPVVAFNIGVYPEIIINNKTGFVVNSFQEMVNAVKKIYEMPKLQYQKMRKDCRQHVEKLFTIKQMVNEYEKAYYEILEKHNKNK